MICFYYSKVGFNWTEIFCPKIRLDRRLSIQIHVRFATFTCRLYAFVGIVSHARFTILSNRIWLIVMLNPISEHLKGHCIEFKYYADGIHSGLTPPG